MLSPDAVRATFRVADPGTGRREGGSIREAIYPRLSRDPGGIPIRNCYFDGMQSDLDRDLGVYMERVRSCRQS